MAPGPTASALAFGIMKCEGSSELLLQVDEKMVLATLGDDTWQPSMASGLTANC